MAQQAEVQEITTVSEPTTQQVVRRTRVVTPQVNTGSPRQEYQTKKAMFHTYQIVWYILGVIEVILAFRVFLKLLGANSASGFTAFIYTVSSPFALPFAGILGISGIEDMVFEWSTLIAMIVYIVIAYGFVSLIQLIKPTNQEEVEQTVDNQ